MAMVFFLNSLCICSCLVYIYVEAKSALVFKKLTEVMFFIVPPLQVVMKVVLDTIIRENLEAANLL